MPDKLTPRQRVRLSEDVLEFIEKRTIKKGLDKNNNKFAPYTKDYQKFKGQKKVDLKLNDEMIKALELISHRRGSLLIGYENGTEQNAKADGNIRGTYGQSKPIKGKARPFLGIFKKDVNALAKKK